MQIYFTIFMPIIHKENSTLPQNMLESFVNDYLKEDLKQLEDYLKNRNSELLDYIQLKNTLETMKEHFIDGFKTMLNVGGNIFMEAKVNHSETVLVNIGKDVYVQFTLEEAITFAKFKINVINKEIEVIREESIKKRADINLAHICIRQNWKFD